MKPDGAIRPAAASPAATKAWLTPAEQEWLTFFAVALLIGTAGSIPFWGESLVYSRIMPIMFTWTFIEKGTDNYPYYEMYNNISGLGANAVLFAYFLSEPLKNIWYYATDAKVREQTHAGGIGPIALKIFLTLLAIVPQTILTAISSHQVKLVFAILSYIFGTMGNTANNYAGVNVLYDSAYWIGFWLQRLLVRSITNYFATEQFVKDCNAAYAEFDKTLWQGAVVHSRALAKIRAADMVELPSKESISEADGHTLSVDCKKVLAAETAPVTNWNMLCYWGSYFTLQAIKQTFNAVSMIGYGYMTAMSMAQLFGVANPGAGLLLVLAAIFFSAFFVVGIDFNNELVNKLHRAMFSGAPQPYHGMTNKLLLGLGLGLAFAACYGSATTTLGLNFAYLIEQKSSAVIGDDPTTATWSNSAGAITYALITVYETDFFNMFGFFVMICALMTHLTAKQYESAKPTEFSRAVPDGAATASDTKARHPSVFASEQMIDYRYEEELVRARDALLAGKVGEEAKGLTTAAR